jgi:hypothetical protein
LAIGNGNLTMDGAAAPQATIEKAERQIQRAPLVLNRRNFSWLTERISGVVEEPAPRVRTLLYWLPDFYWCRHMGKSGPRWLGVGHYKFRFLDRYRTRRHTHLRDLVFAAAKMAYFYQSFG